MGHAAAYLDRYVATQVPPAPSHTHPRRRHRRSHRRRRKSGRRRQPQFRRHTPLTPPITASHHPSTSGRYLLSPPPTPHLGTLPCSRQASLSNVNLTAAACLLLATKFCDVCCPQLDELCELFEVGGPKVDSQFRESLPRPIRGGGGLRAAQSHRLPIAPPSPCAGLRQANGQGGGAAHRRIPWVGHERDHAARAAPTAARARQRHRADAEDSRRDDPGILRGASPPSLPTTQDPPPPVPRRGPQFARRGTSQRQATR